MEIWKPTIISHNYEVSNLGRVRSVERRGMDKRGRLTLKRSFILKPQENNSGYLRVNIYGKLYFIHRLVAQTFIPNPDNLPEINHINEDKKDNSSSNLEWCNRGANVNFGNRNLTVSNKLLGLKTKRVKVFCKEGETIFQSLKDACKSLKISRSTLSRYCINKSTINNLRFEYI